MKNRWSVFGVAAATLVVAVGVAFAMGLLLLPMDPVTVTHGPWLGGTYSTLDITLADVPDGYDVTNGTYVGWCLEDNFLDDPPDFSPLRLVDSTDDPANFPSPCENYIDIRWDRVNYLLNNKIGEIFDIQLALWVLAETDSGRPLTANAQAMIADGIANGDGFVPGPGDVVAVGICADGIDVGTPDGLYQDTIIEVYFDGDGCTPGYWKQPQHLDSWVTYSPDDVFSAVFGVGPDITLLEALEKKGGGEKAFLRHAAAALLNAANPDVAYAYSPTEVIGMVQDAYASGEFEDTKDMFEAANENWCPLN